MEWIEKNCRPVTDPSVHTVFLIPGDLGAELESMREALVLLKERYRDVCFVVGNHDLWVGFESPPSYNSLDKLQDVLSLCDEVGVHTAPIRIVPSSGTELITRTASTCLT
jgi:hypothetical protein